MLISVSRDFAAMQYCPQNISIQDIWIENCVPLCFLETITSTFLGLFILLFGTIQLIRYKKNGIKITNLSTSNKLFCLQVLVHLALIFMGLGILIPKAIFKQKVFGFEVLSIIGSSFIWIMSLALVILERKYQLRNSGQRQHGIVLILTWIGIFVKENIIFLSNEKWW